MIGRCQKRGVAYPCLPYLRRGEPMLFDVRIQLVIRPEVTTNCHDQSPVGSRMSETGGW